MLHANRTWCVSTVESAEELATKLSETTWCCCTAFQIAGHPSYLWLNDSTCEDGAQEYAVCKIEASGEVRQLESITFSWCHNDKALRFIRSTLEGADDANDWAHRVTPLIETPEQHGRCPHCA